MYLFPLWSVFSTDPMSLAILAAVTVNAVTTRSAPGPQMYHQPQGSAKWPTTLVFRMQLVVHGSPFQGLL